MQEKVKIEQLTDRYQPPYDQAQFLKLSRVRRPVGRAVRLDGRKVDARRLEEVRIRAIHAVQEAGIAQSEFAHWGWESRHLRVAGWEAVRPGPGSTEAVVRCGRRPVVAAVSIRVRPLEGRSGAEPLQHPQAAATAWMELPASTAPGLRRGCSAGGKQSIRGCGGWPGRPARRPGSAANGKPMALIPLRIKSPVFRGTIHPTAEWVVQQLREAFPAGVPADTPSSITIRSSMGMPAASSGPPGWSLNAPACTRSGKTASAGAGREVGAASFHQPAGRIPSSALLAGSSATVNGKRGLPRAFIGINDEAHGPASDGSTAEGEPPARATLPDFGQDRLRDGLPTPALVVCPTNN